LLRVLERREVRPVRGHPPKPRGAPTVAGPHTRRPDGGAPRSLPRERPYRGAGEAAALGGFRQDLYYRLAVVELTLPPVRERREDLPVLVAHLIGRANRGSVRGPAPAVRELFASDAWPGNVREIANVIERALPFCDGEMISLEALPDALR